ncbi:MAG: hypothetical protein HY300_12625 [Verrucomicrobia bacterium]|nr:hypothetical protein [Verrucomicrobiota bacterium]
MNQLHKKLIAAARATAPDDRVPYAFEQRVMARLRALPAVDAWACWSRGLWLAAAACVAVTVVVGVLSLALPQTEPQDFTADGEHMLALVVDNANDSPSELQ